MNNDHSITPLDIQIARDVLFNDVWQDEQGIWWEREYHPIPDGYASSVRRLMAYSSDRHAALDLCETIVLRTGTPLKAPFYDPAAVCEEALALNGAAGYRPSDALVALIAASRWEVAAEWEGSVQEALGLAAFRERWPQIYVISHNEDVLYVGQTAQGVRTRLMGHLHAPTLIGGYLRQMKTYEDARLKVLTITTHGFNSLNAAEQHYITLLQPRYNQQGMA